MLVIFRGTNLLSHILHRVQPVSLNGGLLEGEFIITWIYVGDNGVRGIGKIVWRVLVSFFIVDHLV